MPQALILPINRMRVTASFKTKAYRNRFGFAHFGFDCISTNGSAKVYASGEGTVVCTGEDSVVGNVVVICYPQVINHRTGQTLDVIARYFHLASIAVHKGDKVCKDTVIGIYGNTGKYSTGAHLHIEFDSDTAYPLYSSTLGKNSTLILAAITDTSINPGHLLHVKTGKPDSQAIDADKSCWKDGSPYADPADCALPEVP